MKLRKCHQEWLHMPYVKLMVTLLCFSFQCRMPVSEATELFLRGVFVIFFSLFHFLYNKNLKCARKHVAIEGPTNLCRDRNSMSRQGLGLGQAWVATRVSLYRDRVFPGVGHSSCDKRLYVVTEIPRVVLRQNVFLSRPTG